MFNKPAPVTQAGWGIILIKMKLSLKNRLIIQSILPQKGSFFQLMVAEQISKSVSVDVKEMEYYGIESIPEEQGGGLRWDIEKDKKKQKDCELGKEHIKMIKEILEKKSEENDLTQETFELAKVIYEAAEKLD